MSLRVKLRTYIAITCVFFLLLFLAGGYYLFKRSGTALNLTNSVFFVVLSTFLMLCFYGAVMLFLEKLIFKRLQKTAGAYTAMGASDNNHKLDEIAFLEQQLEKKEEEVSEYKHFRLILENMIDLVSEIDHEGRVKYISPSYKKLLGYDLESLQKIPPNEFIHPDDFARADACAQRVIKTQKPDRVEVRCRHADGYYIWFEAIDFPLFDSHGKMRGMLVSSRDITERKKMEERLRQLSQYDALTGLYNRTFFEEEMQRLREGANVPVGVIICDVDGLKLINDGIGHAAGDQMLKNAAFILSRCFTQNTFIARTGGDEFAILLPHSSAEKVKAAAARIEKAVKDFNNTTPKLPLSISVGYAVGTTGELDDVFKEADNRMYQKKLQRSSEPGFSIAHFLMEALQMRNKGSDGSVERLEELVTAFGRVLGLSEQKMEDLRLLAHFHDIGMVGVPDRVIFCDREYTEEERHAMQRHTEIGHRIALSTHGISHIADWILKHHEWYNGQGYPYGLRDKEIPYECRIFAIVDAYDAMTSRRSYRQAKSHQEAIAELKNNAGTQFDPQLVKLFVEAFAHQWPETNFLRQHP